MSNLAIKGHATRSKEVIEILEMLGGTNSADARLYWLEQHERELFPSKEELLKSL